MLAGIFVTGCLGLWVFDRLQFSSESTQRAFLTHYLPEARCQTAHFDLLEREDSIQDWRYVVRVDGSKDCVESIRSALAARGAAKQPPENAEQGLVLPGFSDHEKELVIFNFDAEPSAVIWTRDKT